MSKQEKLIEQDNPDFNIELGKKIGPEEKVKQEKIIPYLREVLGYKLMDFEVPVKFGRMTKFADIVINVIDKNRKVPYMVIECKAPNKIGDDDWLQAESYAQRLGAPYFIVTDGTKRGWFWYKTGKRQGESKLIEYDLVVEDDIQKEGKGLIKFEDLNTLSRVIQQCHDIIRNDEGKDPAESFDEMGKLLFAKMKDERDVKNKLKKDREFKIFRDNKGKSIDTHPAVGDRVVKLFELAKKDYPRIYSEVLELNKEGRKEKKESKSIKKIISINLKYNTIYQIVGVIEPYTFIDTGTDTQGVDIKGSMFEIFLKSTFRGPLGQYFTPREIIDFMVQVIDPKDNQVVLDPACGSGGFLIGSMKKVWNDLHESFIHDKIDDLDSYKIKYAQNNLFGMDINDRLAWVAKMNMVFHGDGHGDITHCNALIKTTRNKDIMEKKYDIILTNPPFGSKISDLKILNNPIFKEVAKTKLTEVLFLSECINLLKPNGKLGIVLPDGVLTNPSLNSVRDFIKNETIIKAVISLPTETFTPYGSSVKTSLVFLEKKNLKDPYHKQDAVFMAIAKNIGYDATGRNTGKSDLANILENYHKFEKKHYKGQ